APPRGCIAHAMTPRALHRHHAGSLIDALLVGERRRSVPASGTVRGVRGRPPEVGARDQNGPTITSLPPLGASHLVTIRCSPASWCFHRTQPTLPRHAAPRPPMTMPTVFRDFSRSWCGLALSIVGDCVTLLPSETPEV